MQKGRHGLVKAILAITSNGVIGKDGNLPWGSNKTDLAYFKNKTMGHCCICGSTTAKTLPSLPGRCIIQLSKYLSFFAAIDLAKTYGYSANQIFIIGGGKVYESTLQYCNKLYVTVMPAYEGDLDYEGLTKLDLGKLIKEYNFILLDENVVNGLVFKEYIRCLQ